MNETLKFKNAAEAIVGGMSVHKAAITFGIPRSNLRRFLQNSDMKKKGGQTKFSVEEEQSIEDLLLSCARLGVPLRKVHLAKVVIAMCKVKGLSQSVFTNPWHRAFLKRHPLVSLRISQAENRKKAREWNAERCSSYIAYVAKLHADGYLQNPNGIFNLDETAFQLGERYSKVYAPKGIKEIETYFDGNDRENVTVLACGNAAGVMLRPLILFDGKVDLASRVNGTNDNFVVGTNASGYMDNEKFTQYIQQEVIPFMASKKNVIIVDGHSSHISNLSFVEACRNSGKDIQILVLPAGQTSKLQPLDKSVFGGVKYNWRRHLAQLHLNTENLPQLTRNTFPAHLNILWPQLHLKECLISGFEKTGLYPFSADVISRTVTTISSPPTANIPSLFLTQMQQVRAGLEGISSLNDSDVERILKDIELKVQGKLVADDIAETMRSQLIRICPTKKKRVKDVRLSSDTGGLWSETAVRIALEERDAEKRKKDLAKRTSNIKTKTSAAKVGKKKSPPKKQPINNRGKEKK